MRYKPAFYAVYDSSGDIEFVGKWQGEVAQHLQVNERTVWNTLNEGRKRVAGQVVIKYEVEKDIQKHIKQDKVPPKFRDEDKRYKRKYLAYDRQGNLVLGPIFLTDMTKELGVHKDTVLDAITKNHLANGHIIRLLNTNNFIPNRLSPHAKEFKIYQYDRKGDLVGWFTNMSSASRITNINYDTIRNCTIKHVSTHEKYYFTDHIPLANYKNITVTFKAKNKPIRLYVSHDGTKEEMSFSKACTYIGTSYNTLKQKMNSETRIIFKGYLVELVQ